MSRVGEPAAAEIEVIASEADAGPFGVRLLLPDDGAGGSPAAIASSLDLGATLAQRGAVKVIRITSRTPLNRSDLKVMVELRWAGGIRLGEYLLRFPMAAAPLDTSAQGVVVEGSGITVVRPVSDAQPEASKTDTAEAALPLLPSAAAPASPEPKAVADPPAGEDVWLVKAGDSLVEIAKSIRHESVLLQQMCLAIFRANPDAFQGGDAKRLIVGTTLSIPKPQIAAAIGRAEALAFYAAQLAGLPSSPEKSDSPTPPAGFTEPPRKGQSVSLVGTPDKAPGKEIASASVAPSKPASTAAEASATQTAQLSGSQPKAIETDIAELQKSLGISSNAGAAKTPHADGMKATDFQSKIWLLAGISGFVLLMSFFLKYRKKSGSTGETTA